jgi:hypothetical protein
LLRSAWYYRDSVGSVMRVKASRLRWSASRRVWRYFWVVWKRVWPIRSMTDLTASAARVLTGEWRLAPRNARLASPVELGCIALP